MSKEIEIIEEMVDTRKRLLRMAADELLGTDWENTGVSEEFAMQEYLDDARRIRIEINVLSRLKRRLVDE